MSTPPPGTPPPPDPPGPPGPPSDPYGPPPGAPPPVPPAGPPPGQPLGQAWGQPAAPQPGQPSAPPPGQPSGPPPGGQPAWGPPPGAPVPLRPDEERTWSILAHVGALLSALVALAFLGPLIVLLVFGNRSRYVRHHAVESLNFQLTALILLVVGTVIVLVTLGIGLVVVVPAAILYGIFWFVVVIIAAIRAANGEWWRYPLTLRLVK